MKTEDLKLIEAYLEGSLDDGSRSDFEKRLLNEPDFANELEQHKLFVNQLKSSGERNQLRQKLDDFHLQLTEKEKFYQLNAGKSIAVFWHQHSSTMLIAASVAVFTVFSFLFVADFLKQSGNNQFAYYKELKRDVEKLKKTQRVILTNLDEKIQTPNSGATAFAISKKGYLLTSYHTVKDADSLVVENEIYKHLKVKLVFADPKKDLALLKITDKKFRSFIDLNLAIKVRKPRLGEKVFTLGFPKEDIVYGEGSIASATGYEGDQTAFQISVPVNPGNSGSPLFDTMGNVIGMISGKHLNEEGSSFAIKPKYLLEFIKSIPKDSLSDLKMKRSSGIASKIRTEQIDQIKDFVLILKVYKD